jgi:hypothetical protein
MNRTNGVCRNVSFYFRNNSSSPDDSKVLPNPKVVRRGVGCQQLNSTTYMTEGNTFEILCNTYYWYTSILFVDYTIDFPTCMNQCVAWNLNQTIKCLGISWASGQYGPYGPSAGGNCYFFWDISQPSTVEGQDSGQLLTSEKAVCADKG